MATKPITSSATCKYCPNLRNIYGGEHSGLCVPCAAKEVREEEAGEYGNVACVGCGNPVYCELDPDTGKAMWKDSDRCEDCWKTVDSWRDSLPNIAYPAGTIWRD